MSLYRQGDVLVTKIDALPRGCVPVERERGRVVLAKGETTGHEHAFDAPNVSQYKEGERQFIEIGGDGATLVHDEHGPIDIGPGVYEVTGQREYTPTGAQRVWD